MSLVLISDAIATASAHEDPEPDGRRRVTNNLANASFAGDGLDRARGVDGHCTSGPANGEEPSCLLSTVLAPDSISKPWPHAQEQLAAKVLLSNSQKSEQLWQLRRSVSPHSLERAGAPILGLGLVASILLLGQAVMFEAEGRRSD
ncbi:MAG: hypothetical protein V2A73_20345 [Pseudomonadota bacterium]